MATRFAILWSSVSDPAALAPARSLQKDWPGSRWNFILSDWVVIPAKLAVRVDARLAVQRRAVWKKYFLIVGISIEI